MAPKLRLLVLLQFKLSLGEIALALLGARDPSAIVAARLNTPDVDQIVDQLIVNVGGCRSAEQDVIRVTAVLRRQAQIMTFAFRMPGGPRRTRFKTEMENTICNQS